MWWLAIAGLVILALGFLWGWVAGVANEKYDRVVWGSTQQMEVTQTKETV